MDANMEDMLNALKSALDYNNALFDRITERVRKKAATDEEVTGVREAIIRLNEELSKLIDDLQEKG